jgi:hypothetical protein
MIDGFDHVGTDHQCNVCQCDFTDDEGGVQGYLGILPVAFCPTCFAGLCDMVGQMNDREWEGLTDDELKELCHNWKIFYGGFVNQFTLAIEAKLKEKNYEDKD